MSGEEKRAESSNGKLISKKQLLEKYGFSYGALYRWKRMGLIPDEWFLKKSTVTGQETFFPEVLICERVELILSKKDGVQLEDLANTIRGDEKKNNFLVISTKYGDKTFSLNEVTGISILSDNKEKNVTELILSMIREEKI